MNLRVDIILEDEQRSANPINAKSLMRMGTIVIPAVVLLLGATAFIKSTNQGNKLRKLKATMKVAGPKQKQAKEIAADMKNNIFILSSINGWKKSHIDWHKQLKALQREVPANIQFDSMEISQNFQLVNKKVAARYFSVIIDGKATGDNAESNLQLLKDRIKEADILSETMDRVVMEGAAANWGNAGKNDRVFNITCSLKPREF